MFKKFTSKYNSRNSSQTSFAPLNPSSSKQQNPERVFGELVSTYGFNGGVPSLPPKSSQSSSSKSSRHQSSVHPSTMVLPSTSTKNYEEAYSNLVSSYGFGSGVPCLPPSQKKTKSSTKTSLTRSSTPPPSGSHSPPSTSSKNYELAFGQLASTYGFGGPVPSLPKRK